MAGKPCPLNCGCGRHRRAHCLPGCRCHRHTARSRAVAAVTYADVPELRSLVLRDEDPTLDATLRSYLTAFDEHLRALARGDRARAVVTRLLMTTLLNGSRPPAARPPGRQRRRLDLQL